MKRRRLLVAACAHCAALASGAALAQAAAVEGDVAQATDEVQAALAFRAMAWEVETLCRATFGQFELFASAADYAGEKLERARFKQIAKAVVDAIDEARQ